MIESTESIYAVVIGFLMAWAIGANDVANAMASTVGSKILTVRMAVIIAAIFEALGAMLASGQVTNMIRYGIVDVSNFSHTPEIFIQGMLSSLMAASSWLIVATYYGLPVSTTHTIIGSVLGFALISVGPDKIEWYNLTEILISWVLSPIVALLSSYAVYKIITRMILHAEDPLQQSKVYVPWLSVAVVGLFTHITIFHCLEPLGLDLSISLKYSVFLLASVVAYSTGLWQVKVLISIIEKKNAEGGVLILHEEVERLFSGLAIISAAGMAFAHGANDVANAIGPVAAIIGFKGGQSLTSQPSVIPFWILQLGASGVVLGLITYGYKIMDTVGSKITQLTPSRGFVAQFTTSAIIMIASSLGLPVSTTQTMVGAILGVGIARGFMALNMKVIRGILISWFITVPAGMILAMIFFLVLQGVY